jgi:hypothetical protein
VVSATAPSCTVLPIEFAQDSLLEQSGFELMVPLAENVPRLSFFETEAFAGRNLGGRGTGKAEEQPHALQKTNNNSPPRRSTRDPQLNCYPPSSSSATVARDCLISSAKPRLQVVASAV